MNIFRRDDIDLDNVWGVQEELFPFKNVIAHEPSTNGVPTLSPILPPQFPPSSPAVSQRLPNCPPNLVEVETTVTIQRGRRELDRLVKAWLVEKKLDRPATGKRKVITCDEDEEIRRAKAQLLETLSFDSNVQTLCQKILNFAAELVGDAEVGGLYLCQEPDWREWGLGAVFPSEDTFFGAFNLSTHLILQAVAQRLSFIVESPQTKLAFLFVPILPDEDGLLGEIGVLILGTDMSGLEARNSCNLFNSLSKYLSRALRHAHMEQKCSYLENKMEHLTREVEKMKDVGKISPGPRMQENPLTMCTSATGIITYISDQFQKFLGYLSTELIGVKTVLMLIAPAEVEERERRLELVLKRRVTGMETITAHVPDETETTVFTFLRNDGSSVQLELATNVMVSESQNPAGYILVARELSAAVS